MNKYSVSDVVSDQLHSRHDGIPQAKLSCGQSSGPRRLIPLAALIADRELARVGRVRRSRNPPPSCPKQKDGGLRLRLIRPTGCGLHSIFGDDANNDRAPKGEQNIGHRIGDSK